MARRCYVYNRRRTPDFATYVAPANEGALLCRLFADRRRYADRKGAASGSLGHHATYIVDTFLAGASD
jgi:hypothetical protein